MMLDENIIRDNIFPLKLQQITKLHIHKSVSSTNDYLKNLSSNAAIHVCCAEFQTAGRGRRSKTWFSPPNENIYCSMMIDLIMPSAKLSALSLVIGLSVSQVLQNLNIVKDTTLKWPNDVYWQDYKLSGVLIEVVHDHKKRQKAIIGIGLNVNSEFKNNDNQAWISLKDITDNNYDRNLIIAKLINQSYANVQLLQNHGFASFKTQWRSRDYLFGKEITAWQNQTKLSGICNGLDDSAHLKLLTANGEILLSSADYNMKI